MACIDNKYRPAFLVIIIAMTADWLFQFLNRHKLLCVLELRQL